MAVETGKKFDPLWDIPHPTTHANSNIPKPPPPPFPLVFEAVDPQCSSSCNRQNRMLRARPQIVGRRRLRFRPSYKNGCCPTLSGIFVTLALAATILWFVIEYLRERDSTPKKAPPMVSPIFNHSPLCNKIYRCQ